MKSFFEHPMYQKANRIFGFICIGIILADFCGYVPDHILGGRTSNLVAAMILMPHVAEDWYNWWQKRKQQNI